MEMWRVKFRHVWTDLKYCCNAPLCWQFDKKLYIRCIELEIKCSKLYYYHNLIPGKFSVVWLALSLGCTYFAEILQHCVARHFFGFRFYIEIAYSNFTFCGAYTLSFLVRHPISAKRAHPWWNDSTFNDKIISNGHLTLIDRDPTL